MYKSIGKMIITADDDIKLFRFLYILHAYYYKNLSIDGISAKPNGFRIDSTIKNYMKKSIDIYPNLEPVKIGNRVSLKLDFKYYGSFSMIKLLSKQFGKKALILDRFTIDITEHLLNSKTNELTTLTELISYKVDGKNITVTTAVLNNPVTTLKQYEIIHLIENRALLNSLFLKDNFNTIIEKDTPFEIYQKIIKKLISFEDDKVWESTYALITDLYEFKDYLLL